MQFGNLISERERKRRIQENKLNAGAPPAELPYSAYPAKQRLVIADGDMFDPARYARMMRIALTCDSPAFTDATDTLLRSTRKERETRLATDFDKHFQSRQSSAALLVIENVKQHCREQMQIIEQRARSLAATYQHPSLIEYAQDRERQSRDLPVFLQTLSEQITREGLDRRGDDKEVFVLSSWKLFMDAWRARAVDADLQKELAAASAKFGSGSGGATKHASSGESESGRSSDDDAKTPAAKRAKKTAKSAARMPSEIG